MITRTQYGIIDDAISMKRRLDASLMTGRTVPAREVRKLVAMGLMESVGIAEPVDEDGAIMHGRREREGFVATEKGLVAHAEYVEAKFTTPAKGGK